METTEPNTPPEDQTVNEQVQKMIEYLDAWKEEEAARMKEAHIAKHGEQLSLLEPLEGVNMQTVRDGLLRVLALGVVLQRVTDARNSIYMDLAGKGLPVKTIRSSVKIAKAMCKRDASQEVLDRCVALALSLLPEYEPEEK